MNKTFLFLGFLMVVAVVSVSGCTSNTSQTNSTSNLGPNDVTIQNFAFSPATLTVKAGTTVKWVNQDSATHQVVSDTGLFNSGDLSKGQSFSFTFNQTGTYAYHCMIHPSMTGSIVVQ